MKKLLLDQNISNTNLIIAMRIMQGNPTPQGQTDFINQVIHAKFLCPCVIEPEPEVGEDGVFESTPDTRVMFHSVANQEKQVFIVAYTDTKEANKNKKEEERHTIVTTYIDFCNILLKNDSPYAGFVINPFSENVIFTREIMMDINKNIHVGTNPNEQQEGEN